MLTGSQYKKSLYDGRAIFFEGERVEDLPRHPISGSRSIRSRGATIAGIRPKPARSIR